MTSIGIDYINQQDFVIDTTKHINIEGMSGMGKSTLLVNLLAVIRKRSFSVIGRQGLCGLA